MLKRLFVTVLMALSSAVLAPMANAAYCQMQSSTPGVFTVTPNFNANGDYRLSSSTANLGTPAKITFTQGGTAFPTGSAKPWTVEVLQYTGPSTPHSYTGAVTTSAGSWAGTKTFANFAPTTMYLTSTTTTSVTLNISLDALYSTTTNFRSGTYTVTIRVTCPSSDGTVHSYTVDTSVVFSASCSFGSQTSGTLTLANANKTINTLTPASIPITYSGGPYITSTAPTVAMPVGQTAQPTSTRLWLSDTGSHGAWTNTASSSYGYMNTGTSSTIQVQVQANWAASVNPGQYTISTVLTCQ